MQKSLILRRPNLLNDEKHRNVCILFARLSAHAASSSASLVTLNCLTIIFSALDFHWRKIKFMRSGVELFFYEFRIILNFA